MTKRYKIWFWVNVGVLVSIFVFKFLWEIGILSEELFREHFEILAWINIPVFFVMLMLLIYSWKKEFKYKILSFLLLISIGLLSILLRPPIMLYCFIAGIAILFPLPFMVRRFSYLPIIPLIMIFVVMKNLNLPGSNLTTLLIIILMAVIALIEIIKSSINKQIPQHYQALSIPLNIGIILLLGSGIVNFAHLLSFNSESVFISGCVIFAISLLYTFLSLPKSNFIDWPQQWKNRFWHYQIIPGILFLVFIILFFTIVDFSILWNRDLLQAYEIDFSKAILDYQN